MNENDARCASSAFLDALVAIQHCVVQGLSPSGRLLLPSSSSGFRTPSFQGEDRSSILRGGANFLFWGASSNGLERLPVEQ